MSSRSKYAVLLLCLGLSATSMAQDADPEASAIWQKLRTDLFSGMTIANAEGVLVLETPKRAEDAAIVPLAVHMRFPQTESRYIEKLWLIIDNNPSPIAALFHFVPETGRADIETRVRVEQYTYIRAIAMTNDAKLYMAVNYVKASGGCSAPASKDAVAARASLGKMRLRVDDALTQGHPALAQLMISHPNDSGLAMDQLTRTYATPHYVRSVEVRYGGKLVMNADVDFSISEDPNFRFYFKPGSARELEAKVTDNKDLVFTAKLKLDEAQPTKAVSTAH
ncbi:MAG: quinoprotein dehydrogenase-associated SoxYZ-like carrier [Betaproteobacteria bacterium]|nr:MAG: quinoprotein dehydrogenase-associated SoxYZ-like carrier [Betaproteobacteria bacterium]